MSTPTLNGQFPHVYSDDPALQATVVGEVDEDDGEGGKRKVTKEIPNPAFDYAGFKERGDMALVPAKPGERVTRFQLRHLRGLARRRAQSYVGIAMAATGADTILELAPVAGELFYRLCALGLVGIEPGSSLLRPGGAPLPQIRHTRDDQVNVVAEDVMAELDEIDDGGLVSELGVRVMEALKPSPK